MKKLITLWLAVLAVAGAYAQAGGGIKGTVISRTDKARLEGVAVTLNTPQPRTTHSGNQGAFEFKDVPDGVWTLTFESDYYTATQVTVRVSGAVREVLVSLSPEFRNADGNDDFAEFDTESADDSYQSAPLVLTASKDVFDNIASYNFSKMRFRQRGYESSHTDIYFNGIAMNDAQSGYSPWSLWGGLNDVTRNQENTSGLMIPDYGVGLLGGTTAINATASQLRPGFRASLVNGNATYRFRAMATYASGENSKGWSYALSASTRQGGSDWVRGLYYDAFSYYMSVEKQFDCFGRIALTFFGAPTERGTQAAATQETFDLVGSNYYNPNWGYQGGTNDIQGRYSGGGEMRNARVRDNHEPVAILNYSYDLDADNKILAAVSYRFGRNGYTALDWLDVSDPRPDYYRYLPSYFESNPDIYNEIREGWLSSWNIRQLDWNRMYNANYENFFSGNDVTNPSVNSATRRSVYVIEERRADQRDLNVKVQLLSVLDERMKATGGLDYRWNRTEYFKQMKDLMGGDYWLDIDKYAERDFAGGDTIQNDLNHPNRLISKGDKYGYDYYGFTQSARLWGTLRYTEGPVEAYAALEAGLTGIWRKGLYRKGLFPDDSYGDSKKKVFPTGTVKLGGTYKFSGKHIVYANVAAMAEAPYFAKAMVSPRTRNDFLPGLKTQKYLSVDVNYSMKLRSLTMRVSGYCTAIKDQCDIISYYNDLQGTFSNFAMSGIDQRHMGVEVGFKAPIPWVDGLNLEGALSYGYYIYTSNPRVTETADNTAAVVLDNEPVYWKDYKVEGTPQTAASLGLDYRSQKNLFLGLDCGYYNANYISMNPKRRTDQAMQNLTYDQMVAMARQERFPQAFLLNASLGKFWYLGKYMLGLNLNVDNILNNQDVKTGGYEQMRLSKTTDSATGLTTYSPFDSKYFYLMGTTYYLNVYVRF